MAWKQIDGILQSKNLDIKSRFNLLPIPLKKTFSLYICIFVYFCIFITKITEKHHEQLQFLCSLQFILILFFLLFCILEVSVMSKKYYQNQKEKKKRDRIYKNAPEVRLEMLFILL